MGHHHPGRYAPAGGRSRPCVEEAAEARCHQVVVILEAQETADRHREREGQPLAPAIAQRWVVQSQHLRETARGSGPRVSCGSARTVRFPPGSVWTQHHWLANQPVHADMAFRQSTTPS